MTLKLHHLRPAPGAKTAKTRVGRGEASKGKTAGRGTKGTKARYQVPASFEGGQMPIHMRLPKLKGFKNPFKVEFQVVNLDRLNELFPQGGAVSVGVSVIVFLSALINGLQSSLIETTLGSQPHVTLRVPREAPRPLVHASHGRAALVLARLRPEED